MSKYLLILTAFATAVAADFKSVPTILISAPVRGGFVDTDKEIQDSVNDVRKKLRGMKEFRVVQTRREAEIVLTVVIRGVGSETYGRRIRYSEQGGPYYVNAQLTSESMIAETLG